MENFGSEDKGVEEKEKKGDFGHIPGFTKFVSGN